MINFDYMKYNETKVKFNSLKDFLEDVDIEPEELQRGIVCSDDWQSKFFLSVIKGVKLPEVFLSEQEEHYSINDRNGSERLVKFKNIDGLQRITTIQDIMNGKVRLPRSLDDYPELEGMNYPDIQKAYPELARKIKFTDLDFVIYTGLSNKEESYQFRIVLNNGNKMEAQQKRNPIVAEIASHVRRNSRSLRDSDCHKVFSISETNGKEHANCFNFVPKKMQFDLEYARILFWIKNGISVSAGNPGLDNMYLDPSFERHLDCLSVLYNRQVNLGDEGLKILDKLYDIFGDAKYIQEADIRTLRSAVLFIFELQKWEKSNGKNEKDLSELFWKLHDELIKFTPEMKKAGLKYSTYDGNLSKISVSSNVIENCEQWQQLIEKEV